MLEFICSSYVLFCTVCTLISRVDPDDEDAVHPDQPPVDAEGDLRHHHPQESRVQPFSASEVFATRVCSYETLVSFSSTFPVLIFTSLVMFLKTFDDVPKLRWAQTAPALMGKQALSTQVCLCTWTCGSSGPPYIWWRTTWQCSRTRTVQLISTFA